MMKIAKTIALAAAASILPLVAPASTVTITATEENGNVILSGTGSWDLSGFDSARDEQRSYFDDSETGYWGVSERGNVRYLYPTTENGGSSTWSAMSDITFSIEAYNSGTSSWQPTGDNFGINSYSSVYLPAASEASAGGTYTLNDFTWTVANKAIDDLSLNFGTLFTSQIDGQTNNTVTLVDGRSTSVAPVPLPASILFLGAGIGGLGLMARRRRSAA